MNIDIFDHMLVILQLEFASEQVNCSFMFNHAWMEESDFIDLVQGNWHSLANGGESSLVLSLVTKLKSLKIEVIAWEKRKKVALKEELVGI